MAFVKNALKKPQKYAELPGCCQYQRDENRNKMNHEGRIEPNQQNSTKKRTLLWKNNLRQIKNRLKSEYQLKFKSKCKPDAFESLKMYYRHLYVKDTKRLHPKSYMHSQGNMFIFLVNTKADHWSQMNS